MIPTCEQIFPFTPPLLSFLCDWKHGTVTLVVYKITFWFADNRRYNNGTYGMNVIRTNTKENEWVFCQSICNAIHLHWYKSVVIIMISIGVIIDSTAKQTNKEKNTTTSDIIHIPGFILFVSSVSVVWLWATISESGSGRRGRVVTFKSRIVRFHTEIRF